MNSAPTNPPAVPAAEHDRSTDSQSSPPITAQIEKSLDLLHDATAAALDVKPIEQPDITIIVPVFNEASTLPHVLQRIDAVMPPATEVIVIDDGSTDGTAGWLESLPRRHSRKIICRRRNHGKGSAVRLAIRHSRGRVVAIQDADLEYDPVDLLGAIDLVLAGDADVVYGSRYLHGTHDPSLFHRLGNWLLTRLSNCFTGLRLTDMETCHKAFRGDLIRSIPLRECRFGFEPEITAKIASREVAIKEVPTAYDCRSYEDGKKIGWRDGVAALACMWKYRHG
jgi:glycosyltransferase involved in cell wall biosynthesis